MSQYIQQVNLSGLHACMRACVCVRYEYVHEVYEVWVCECVSVWDVWGVWGVWDGNKEYLH